ncbi:MAG: AAA family ATPase, partial [Gemmatimonadaceae bacterium]|nr:AAA family ATPase [Gemmatimonadaceae bacterium]
MYPGVYRRRTIDAELDQILAQLPAIVIEGPKGVGKTLTAEQRAGSVIRLDDRAQCEMVQAHPASALRGARPVLLDEWQRVPEIWDVVRRAVDADGRANQFLLTGSAAPLRPPTHSGAGRIVPVRMWPMTLAERGIEAPTVSLAELLTHGQTTPISGSTAISVSDYTREIMASGFPGMRSLSGRALRAQLDGYLAAIVDRDIPEFG